MVGSIVVVGTLTCCALLHPVCDLKAAQKNVLYNLIWELIFYEFKLGYMEATKTICCPKGQGAVDYRTVTGMVQEISLGLEEPRQGMFRSA